MLGGVCRQNAEIFTLSRQNIVGITSSGLWRVFIASRGVVVLCEFFGWGLAVGTLKNLILCRRQRHIPLWRKRKWENLPRAVVFVFDQEQLGNIYFSFECAVLWLEVWKEFICIHLAVIQNVPKTHIRDYTQDGFRAAMNATDTLDLLRKFPFIRRLQEDMRSKENRRIVSSNSRQIFTETGKQASRFWKSELYLSIFALFEGKANEIYSAISCDPNILGDPVADGWGERQMKRTKSV